MKATIVNYPGQVIGGSILLAVAYVLYRHLFFRSSRQPRLPIVGSRKGDIFPALQAQWRNTVNTRAALFEAYESYKDQPSLLRSLDIGDVVMLPASETQWMVEQPDDIMSMHKQTMGQLLINHTMPEPRLFHQPFHQKILTTNLTSQIGNLVPDIVDELTCHVDQYWAADENWTEVCVSETMKEIVCRITNRVFVGLPYCRDKQLIKAALAFSEDVPKSVILLRLLWAPLRSIASLIITIPNRIHWNQFCQALRGEIQRRLQQYDVHSHLDRESSPKPLHNDFLQWNIKHAKASNIPYEYHWKTLAGRLLVLNFAAVHTTSFTITGALLDLVSSKPKYIDELREEIYTVLREHGGKWSKQALAKMGKLDSTLRESARMNSIVALGLGREVTAKEGITTPSGVHLAYGTRVFCHGHPVFWDAKTYPNPEEFQPFRFVGKRLECTDYTKSAKNTLVTTSTEFLAFGHGRNACPGRFFAACQLKLLLGYLLMNYDFEMKETRPRNLWLMQYYLPPLAATIRIRKRSQV